MTFGRMIVERPPTRIGIPFPEMLNWLLSSLSKSVNSSWYCGREPTSYLRCSKIARSGAHSSLWHYDRVTVRHVYLRYLSRLRM